MYRVVTGRIPVTCDVSQQWASVACDASQRAPIMCDVLMNASKKAICRLYIKNYMFLRKAL